MAIYERKYYDKKGKCKLKAYEKLTCSLGRWKSSQEFDKRDGIKTRLHTGKTRKGLNTICTGCYSKFPDGTKMTTRLITTSNKMPKNTKSKGKSYY